MSGLVSHCAGLGAEEIAARWYGRHGGTVCARRWRGGGGEIDLIVEQAGATVFVEVKAARTVAAAAGRIAPAQQARLFRAAEAYLVQRFGDADRDARFDVALVGRDGGFDVVENAFL